MVFLARFSVECFDDKLCGKHVGEFGAVAIATADDAVFGIVIVVAGQQLAKDHLRHVHVFGFMHDYGDTGAVVFHRDEFASQVDFDILHVRVALLVVSGVDQNFIENLQEARHVADGTLFEALVGFVPHPHRFMTLFARADVGVGACFNVFQVGLFLILFRDNGGPRHVDLKHQDKYSYSFTYV